MDFGPYDLAYGRQRLFFSCVANQQAGTGIPLQMRLYGLATFALRNEIIPPVQI